MLCYVTDCADSSGCVWDRGAGIGNGHGDDSDSYGHDGNSQNYAYIDKVNDMFNSSVCLVPFRLKDIHM